MSFPSHWLNTTFVCAGCALAGMGVAGLFMPPSEPGPSAVVRGNRPAAGAAGRKISPQTAARLEFLQKAGTPTQQLAAVLRFASVGSTDEIRNLLDQSEKFPAHSAATLAVHALLKRWLELDPGAVLEYSRIHKEKSLAKLIGSWSATDPAGAEAYILTLPPGDSKAEAWKELCAVTADKDPEKAWELIARVPSRGNYSSTYEIERIVEKLVAQDPEGSLARMAGLPTDLLKATRGAIARQLMETDPARGWDWLRQQPKQEELMGKALGQSFEKDPVQALALYASLSPEQQEKIRNNYGYNWQNKDSAAVVSAFSQAGLSPREKDSLGRQFFNRSSYFDPAGATRLLPLLSEGNRVEKIPNLVNNWKEQDPAAVRAWVAGLPPGPERSAAESALEKETSAEIAVVRDAPQSLIDAVKQKSYIQAEDPRLAKLTTANIAEMMSGTGSSHYIRNVLTGLGKMNPLPAAAWLETVTLDSRTGVQAAQFSAVWAQEDPLAAAAWVSKLPDGPLAVTTATNVARQYQRYAPEQVRAWISTLPAGAVQKAAGKALAE